jgi:branched-chain amino acid transport system permease protein
VKENRHPALRPRLLAGWVAVATVLFAMPTLQRTFGFAIFNLIFLYFVFFWVTQATSWNIFCGYSGYFSFGQGAFYGAGLYVTANLTARYGTSLLPALPLAGLVAGLIALVTGVLVFRLRKLTGEIFALFTLAVALALGSLANNWGFIDGGRGIPIGRVDYPQWLGSVTEMLYYLGLALALATVFLAFAIQHSRFGVGLFAIRDDERVAESIGVPTFRYKLVIFTLSGVVAGVSGALHAVQVNFISPAGAFNIRVPLFVIVMSVVGGRRHWLGPVLGAVLIHTVTDRLVGLGLAEQSQVLLAVVLIAATLFLRGGIISRLQEKPLPALVVALVVLLGQLALVDAPVISQAAVAMVAAMFALFVPDRLYDALPGPWRKPLPTELDAELQADDRLRQMEEVQ